MWILYAGEGQGAVLAWNSHFLCSCDSAKVPFKSRLSTAWSGKVYKLVVLHCTIANELLKKPVSGIMDAVFFGLSYYKFWHLFGPIQAGHQLQFVWIWCPGMEGYSPSQTLLHTPSIQAAQLFRLANPSQVGDNLDTVLEDTFCKWIHDFFQDLYVWIQSLQSSCYTVM